jgi:hypothetical protein
VGAADFEEQDGQPTLIVVLQDEGYPGSTYLLVYLAERGVLVGTYARPGSQPAEVYFVRQAAD